MAAPTHRATGRGLTAVLAALTLFVLSACGSGSEAAPAAPTSSGPVTVTHAQGTATLQATPTKVVVFDIGALVTLDDLGVPVAGVPKVEGLPERLAKYAGDQYTKVGTLFEPDYEKVNELAPDLIIIGGRSAPAYAELSKIATTIDLTVDNAKFLTSLRERVEAVGAVFGKQDQVRGRLDALSTKISEIAGRTPAQGKRGLIVLTTGGKMSAYGPGSRFGLIHDALGVQPAAEGLGTDIHGNAVSAEFIAQTNPDVIYVIDRDSAIGDSGQAARQVLDNALVNGTNAARNNRVVYLEPFPWYVAPTGLSSVESMVTAIGDSLS
ncbi:siderophore ABC transporter substrate-binding protein [Saccharothrix obliqua]|uniref:siderophore ABC transporter substrate-binding protein n=1 Tax=Saccharothrix obliqua TaxID=2861747 RepID=UPI0027E32B7A|nr:siderophore ABC transporter substrate-binding protein [Saccharothrix obliqua]